MARTSVGREAMDRATGAVQKVTGAVTGREDLEYEGELHAQRADAAKEARIEDERAEVTEELADAERRERDAAGKRAQLLEEKARQEEETRIEREEKAEREQVAARTRRGKRAVQAEAEQEERSAEVAEEAVRSRTAWAEQLGLELRREARTRGDKAQSYESQVAPSTAVGKAVNSALTITRTPLTVVERATGHRDRNWTVAGLYEAAEARLLHALGVMLRSDDLLRQGRAKQAASQVIGEAVEAAEAAEEVEATAQEQEQIDLTAARRGKQQARRTATERRQRLEAEQKSQEEQVEKRARSRKQAVGKRAAAAQKGRANRNRTDALQTAEKDQTAAQRRAKAARSEQKVVALDEKLNR